MKRVIFPILLILCVFAAGVFYVIGEQYKTDKKVLEEKQENVKKEIQELKKKNEELQKKINEMQKAYEDLKLTMVDESTLPQKIAYLTFDDGPSLNTARNLDTLKRYGVHATFFVNGHTGTFSEQMYRRIVNEGHVLGNHTYSHDYQSIYKSVATFQQDVDKLQSYIGEITGVKPKIVRFPGGSNNTVSYSAGGKGITLEIAKDLRAKGYQYFDWNVDSADASAITQSKNIILNNVLNQSKGRSKVIVLMHDSEPKTTTADALPQMIEGLKAQGFEFRTLHTYSFTHQFLK